jgi:hypothetical protein
MLSTRDAPKPDTPDVAAAPATHDDFAQAYRPYMRAVLEDQQPAITRELADDQRRQAAVAELSGAGDHHAARNGKWTRRILLVLLLASIGGVAIISQLPSGDAVRTMMAAWSTQPVPGSSAIQPAQPSSDAVVPTNPAPIPVRPIVAAEDAPRQTDTATAALSPEQAKVIETMPGALADLEQRIEQLKASQAQLIRENAKVVAELKASQERIAQMALENAQAVADLKAAVDEKARVVTTGSTPDRPLVSARDAHGARLVPRQAVTRGARMLARTEGIVRPVLVLPPQGPLF